MGSFSLSAEMLAALLDEFKSEIAGKTAKMDSDPHFWMPLTLAKDAYVSVMITKDESAEAAAAHHDRMQAFRAKLPGTRGVFGAVDVGEGCYWWDYGQLKLYLTNNVLAMNESEEAAGEFLLTRLWAIRMTDVFPFLQRCATISRSPTAACRRRRSGPV